jgi:hypothetical protein
MADESDININGTLVFLKATLLLNTNYTNKLLITQIIMLVKVKQFRLQYKGFKIFNSV